MKKKYILISILLIVFLLLTILVLTGSMKSFDSSIYNFLINLRSKSMDTFMKTITKFGNTMSVIIILAIFVFILKKDDGYLLVMNTICVVSANQVLKHIIRRPRPDHLRLVKEKGFSFPSGHSMVSIALYGILIYIVNKNIKNKTLKIILIALLSLLILFIGLSRIYVGVHYPSDVLSGYILATVITILVIDYYNTHFRGNKNDKNGSK